MSTEAVVRPVRDVDAEALGRVHATCWHETYDHLISEATLANLSPRRMAELWTHWMNQGPELPPVRRARRRRDRRLRRLRPGPRQRAPRARASCTSSTCWMPTTAPASARSSSTPPVGDGPGLPLGRRGQPPRPRLLQAQRLHRPTAPSRRSRSSAKRSTRCAWFASRSSTPSPLNGWRRPWSRRHPSSTPARLQAWPLGRSFRPQLQSRGLAGTAS